MVRKLIPSVFAPLSLLPDCVRRAVVRRFLDVVWGHYADIHVEGLSEPVVASRSEKAILAEIEAALTEAAGIPRRRRTAKGQETLL